MNYKKLLSEIENKNSLKVTLKKTKKKGVGLFAIKKIEEGEIIAYYKIKIFRRKDYVSPTDFIYTFEVYRKNGEKYKTLIGDIDENSFPKPEKNITFWGPFANEPDITESINSEIEINLKKNYSDKNYSSPGEYMIYELVATKNIKRGEEILWYYGEGYNREYEVGK